MEDVLRLPPVPAGAELLPGVDLARRVCGRLPVPLHQRARPRQHPEGRHLLGRAADVGRPHQSRRAARDRGRGGEVQHPDRQDDWRTAHRHAGREEGGPAGRLGGSEQGRHGFGPRLRQGAAHGEDLRRLGILPLRHADGDGPWREDGEVHVGRLDAAQGQARRIGLPAQLRRGDL